MKILYTIYFLSYVICVIACGALIYTACSSMEEYCKDGVPNCIGKFIGEIKQGEKQLK